MDLQKTDPFITFAKNENDETVSSQLDTYGIIDLLVKHPTVIGSFLAGYVTWCTERNGAPESKLNLASKVMRHMVVDKKDIPKFDALKSVVPYMKYFNGIRICEDGINASSIVTDSLGQSDLRIIMNAMNCALYSGAFESFKRHQENVDRIKKSDRYKNKAQYRNDMVLADAYIDALTGETGDTRFGNYAFYKNDGNVMDTSGDEMRHRVLSEIKAYKCDISIIHSLASRLFDKIMYGDMISFDRWESDIDIHIQTANLIRMYTFIALRSIFGKDFMCSIVGNTTKELEKENPKYEHTSEFNKFVEENKERIFGIGEDGMRIVAVLIGMYNTISSSILNKYIDWYVDPGELKMQAYKRELMLTQWSFMRVIDAIREVLDKETPKDSVDKPGLRFLKIYNGTVYALYSGNTHIDKSEGWELGQDETNPVTFAQRYHDVYSKTAFKKYIDDVKDLKATPEYSKYEEFTRNLNWYGSKFIDYMNFFTATVKPNEMEFNPRSRFSNILSEVMTNDMHKMVFEDNSEYSTLCYMSNCSKAMMANTIKLPMSKYIGDVIMIMLGNAKIRGDFENQELKFLPLYGLASYIAAMSSGITDYIKYISNDCGKGVLLTNLLNTGLAFQYRSIRLPVNKFRKEGQYATLDYYKSAYDIKDNTKKDFIEIFQRVTIDTDVKNSGPLVKLNAVVKYLGDAISNNSINAEYAILILLQCYDYTTLKELGLVFNQGHEKVNVFKQIIDYLFQLEGINGNALYDFFHKPIVNEVLLLARNNAIEKEISTSNNEDYIKTFIQHLEPIVFITILQRIANNVTVENELSKKSGPAFFSDIESMCGYLDGCSGTEMYNALSGSGGEKKYIEYKTAVSDIEMALNKIDSIMSEFSDTGDWFEQNKDKIIPAAGGEVKTESTIIPAEEYGIGLESDKEISDFIYENYGIEVTTENPAVFIAAFGLSIIAGIIIAGIAHLIGENSKDKATIEKLKPLADEIEKDLHKKYELYKKAYEFESDGHFIDFCEKELDGIGKVRKGDKFLWIKINLQKEEKFVKWSMKSLANYYRTLYSGKKLSIKTPIDIDFRMFNLGSSLKGIFKFAQAEKIFEKACTYESRLLGRFSKEITLEKIHDVYVDQYGNRSDDIYASLTYRGHLTPSVDKKIKDALKPVMENVEVTTEGAVMVALAVLGGIVLLPIVASVAMILYHNGVLNHKHKKIMNKLKPYLEELTSYIQKVYPLYVSAHGKLSGVIDKLHNIEHVKASKAELEKEIDFCKHVAESISWSLSRTGKPPITRYAKIDNASHVYKSALYGELDVFGLPENPTDFEKAFSEKDMAITSVLKNNAKLGGGIELDYTTFYIAGDDGEFSVDMYIPLNIPKEFIKKMKNALDEK